MDQTYRNKSSVLSSEWSLTHLVFSDPHLPGPQQAMMEEIAAFEERLVGLKEQGDHLVQGCSERVQSRLRQQVQAHQQGTRDSYSAICSTAQRVSRGEGGDLWHKTHTVFTLIHRRARLSTEQIWTAGTSAQSGLIGHVSRNVFSATIVEGSSKAARWSPPHPPHPAPRPARITNSGSPYYLINLCISPVWLW